MGKPKLTIGVRMERVLAVNHSDPDIARRGRLLNILLLGLFAGAVVSVGIALIFSFLSQWSNPSEGLVVIVGAVALCLH